MFTNFKTNRSNHLAVNLDALNQLGWAPNSHRFSERWSPQVPQPVSNAVSAPCMSTKMSTQSHGALKYRGSWNREHSWRWFHALISVTLCYIFRGGKPHLQPRSKQAQFVLRSALLASTSVVAGLGVEKWQVCSQKKSHSHWNQHGKWLKPQVLKVSIQISENIKIHQGTWSICIEVLCHCHCHMHIILC